MDSQPLYTAKEKLLQHEGTGTQHWSEGEGYFSEKLKSVQALRFHFPQQCQARAGTARLFQLTFCQWLANRNSTA